MRDVVKALVYTGADSWLQSRAMIAEACFCGFAEPAVRVCPDGAQSARS